MILAIAQFSTYGFKSDPNTNVGEEYLYTSCTSCPTNIKPAAFSYFQFDNQPMTLTKINYHVCVYEIVLISNSLIGQYLNR